MAEAFTDTHNSRIERSAMEREQQLADETCLPFNRRDRASLIREILFWRGRANRVIRAMFAMVEEAKSDQEK